MRKATWLITGVLLASASAGCILGDDGDAVAPAASGNGTSQGTVLENQTAAPDGRGDLAAFKESNATESEGVGAMEHKHDYWGGETRKVIADFPAGLIPIPLLPEGKAAGTAIADFDLEAPNVVYEGTKQLEVVFSNVTVWGGTLVEAAGAGKAPDHPAISIYVDYLTAMDDPGQFRAAGQAQPDQPLIIPVDPQQADMPHQEKSLWVFRIYTGEANAWTFNVTITAVKGYDVVDWPPHPDLYRDRPTRSVFEGAVSGEYTGDAANFLYGDDANWVYPDRIISYGTDSVEVLITRGAWNAQTPEPAADEFELQFTNASYIPKVGNGDPAGGHLQDDGTDGSSYRFIVPVDPAGFDTPYGTASRWGFRFVPTSEPYGRMPWSHDYTMTILAHGHSIEEAGDGPNAS